MKAIALPDGAIAEFPDTMTDASIEAVLRQQYRGAAPTPLVPRSEVMGRTAQGIGSFLSGMVPTTLPGAIGLVASLIPGAGIGRAVLRPLLAAGTAAGVEAARGREPGAGALEAGVPVVGGQVVGGGLRAVARGVARATDPLTTRLGTLLGRLVPAFRGDTPRRTLINAMGTEGQIALSREYGAAVDRAIADAGNPVISMRRSGLMGPADEIWNYIKSEKRRLFNAAGEPTRTKGVFQSLDDVYAAEEAFAKTIEGLLPPGSKGLFARANARYRLGKEVQDLFTGGVGTMTPEKVQSLLSAGERWRLNQPDLASRLALRAGALREAMEPVAPGAYGQLEQLITRGAGLGARDVTGAAPHVRVHWGASGMPTPSFYGMPQLGHQVGQPERIAGMAAGLGRAAGTRAIGSAMAGAPEPEPVSRSHPAVQRAKHAGLTDEEIERRYGIRLTE